MKKTILSRWLLTALAAMAVFSASAAKKTFTAVASNVDGLPPVVHINALGVVKRDITMNEDGSVEKGATRMGQLFQNRKWDLIGLSEDFNYHAYITQECNTYYNSTTYRGKIEQENLDGAITGYLSQSVHMNTDGLNLLYRNKYRVLSETIVKWNDHHGYDDHEADGLINKGFRKYEVSFGDKLNVDVYITHMDAGSCDAIGDCEEGTKPEDKKCDTKIGGDIGARTKQMQQLVAYIKANTTTNPVIIIGDTNCRYTRDSMKEDLIDAINADPRFTISDPWIEQDFWKERGGFDAPELQRGQGSVMVSNPYYGEQHGEVVDKVFYINNTDSECTITCQGYLHDDGFTYADGSQISDHYPVVATLTIENDYEPAVSPFVIPDAPEKTAVVNGGKYYIRNLGTGEFIRAGKEWGTKAILDSYGNEITLDGSGNSFAMKTQSWSKYLGWDGQANAYYMDFGADNKTKWTFTQVDKNIYLLTDNAGRAMAAGNGVPVQVDANAGDKKQQWEFLTQADLVNELYYALSDEPKDATFYMPGSAMQSADANVGDWKITLPKSGIQTNNCEVRKLQTGDFSCFGAWHKGNSGVSKNNAWKIERTITGLPAGTYKVSYQAVIFSSNHTFTINGTTAELDENGASVPDDNTILANMKNGSYAHDITLKISNEGTYANKIVIYIDKTHTSTKTKAYYGNFKITCLGLEGKVDDRLYERVQAAIDDVYKKASEEGAFVNLSGLQVAVDDRDIQGDGWQEVKQAYSELAEATLKNTEVPADYTYALLNPSFELYPTYKNSKYPNIGGGYPFGWNYPSTYAEDSGVWPASDSNKLTDNPDGEYIYNTWQWGEGGGYALAQEVGLTPGIYQLSAMVASGEGKNVYLFVDNGTKQYQQMVTCVGNNTLVPVSVNFVHSGGKNITIGVVGANGTALDYSAASSWYKADNFRLTRIGDASTITGMEMLQLAINETTQRIKNMNQYDSEWSTAIAKYQAMIDNYTLTGDGKKEFEEVYDLLRERLFADVPDSEKDYTYALANPSFEWGNTYGWDLLSTLGDIGVKENSNSTYTMSGCDGTYVFNAYQNDAGTIISQKINNIPAGHYVLQATLATWANNYAFLEVVGQEGVASQREIYLLPNDEKTGYVKTLEFDVAEGTPSITIRAGGCNTDGSWNDYGGRFFKVDNFKLIRKGAPDICFFYQRLLNAINEANEVAAELPEKYASQWDASDFQDLYDSHYNVAHQGGSGDEDPMHSSGINEINELFQRLRDLIFSQTETGADMSGAITNNSFELGDLTGWTCAMDPEADAMVCIGTPGTPTYGTNGIDEEYLFNAWIWPGNAHPIYQVIPNVPAGRYTLTVKVASDAGNRFFIGANEQHSEIFEIQNGSGDFADFSFSFEVPVELGSQDVKIGVYPTTLTHAGSITEASFADDAEGPWYKVDHFRLTLDSRYMEIDWEMESDTHGTIMLPFAVSADELAEKQLEAYTIKMAQKSSNETPADEDINTYRLLTWDGPHASVLPNVPYVLKNVAPEVEAARNKVRAKVGENEEANSSRIYTFSGYTQMTSDDVISPEGNLLTGTLVEIPAELKQHHFQQVDDNVGFVLHDHADDNDVAHETVPAYHAYIDLPDKELFENGRLVSAFYFFEPIEYLDWEPETEDFGTLILPFDAPLPDGLKAYRLFSANEGIKSVNLGESDGETYQLINLTEVTETMEITDNEGNTVEAVKLTANTPYLIEVKSAPKAAKHRISTKADDAETSNAFVFSGQPTNTEESYKLEGLMTGVIVSRDDKMGFDENGQFSQNSLDTGDRILTGDAESGYKFEAVTERTALPRYHAYIDSETTNGANALATHLLFEEPDYTVEWNLEGGMYGTIILPFDATVPDDLEAYTISVDEAAEAKAMPGEEGKTYQMLTKVEALTLEAHKPYLMIVKTETPEPGEEIVPQSATVAVDGDVYTFSGKRGDNETPETNGVLTGTYSASSAAKDDYQLTADGKGFAKVTDETAPVNTLHAYIKAGDLNGTDADYLLLAEPEDEHTAIDEIFANGLPVDVYNLQGVMLKTQVSAAEALRELDHGIYILRAGDKSVKVLK